MEYKELDVNSVIPYLESVDRVMDYFGGDDLRAQEIGDGNLNYVYLVSSVQDAKKALIVKQAVPYLRCVGEEFTLSRKRMTYEIRALTKFKEIAPDFVPELYHVSQDMSIVVMQYLDKHIILRGGLIDAKRYPNFSEHISTYLANTLFKTSSLFLDSTSKRKLIDEFNSNTELCKLTEDFVFTFAYMQNETNDNENVKDNPLAKKFFADMEFKERVLDLKYKFMVSSDALIHGDLHTGSIMLNEYETYVIDPEFAFVGPFGFDIGALVANLVNNYIHHTVVTKDEDFKEYLLGTIRETLELFESKFLKLWKTQTNSALLIEGYIDDKTAQNYRKKFLKSILQESVGFAGCKMARRVFGVAGVAEIRGIEDKKLRADAEELALKIAKEFVMKYESVNSVDEIINIIKEVRLLGTLTRGVLHDEPRLFAGLKSHFRCKRKIVQGKYRALWLNDDDFLEVIDQTKLPFSYETKVLKTTDEVVLAIKDMTVRGAGVIGSVAAFGIYTACMEVKNYDELKEKALLIRESRPTAINLMWAVDKMMELLKGSSDLIVDAKKCAIELNDKEALESQNIAKYGCDIIEDILKKKNKTRINILTHCNAGWLAVIDEGTALAPIYEAKKRGIDVHVWVDETRPRNQGASLTAWELKESGVNHTIIADNTGGHLMQIGEVDMVITGADRVSANGDVANKIGTYLKALAAFDNDVPFYVAIPASTFDFDIKDGVKEIPIELRSEDEVKYMRGLDAEGIVREVLITPKDSPAINYGFDVTPARLITGLITDRGVCKADYEEIKKKFNF